MDYCGLIFVRRAKLRQIRGCVIDPRIRRINGDESGLKGKMDGVKGVREIFFRILFFLIYIRTCKIYVFLCIVVFVFL